MYKFGLTKGILTDKVADILINGCSDPSKIATLVPTAVEKNVVFIVKTTALGVKCDDLGSWVITGTKKTAYEKKERKVQKRDSQEKVSRCFRSVEHST